MVDHVYTACVAQAGEKVDVGDCASVLVKSGDPLIAVPSSLPDDGRARLAMAISVGGSGEPARQVIARVPFADERAEDVLTEKAKQPVVLFRGAATITLNSQRGNAAAAVVRAHRHHTHIRSRRSRVADEGWGIVDTGNHLRIC